MMISIVVTLAFCVGILTCRGETVKAPPGQLVAVNQSARPVFATAIDLPTPGSPIEAVTRDGAVIPFYPAEKDGKAVARAYFGMEGHERVDLTLRPASSWGRVEDIALASYDAETGTGRLSNGLLTMDYCKDRWSLAFCDLADKGDTGLLDNVRMDYWLDAERRGRLMGIDDDKVAELGLIRSASARLVKGSAEAGPDGSATLVLERRFDGMAANVVWEERYTLLAGEPVLLYKARWSCTDDQPRYLAFVDLGGGMKGEYGSLLQGDLRFKYENPGEGDALGGESAAASIAYPATPHSRIILSGPNNSFTRLAWRDERVWVGVDSDLGCGLGFSSLKHITREIQGSSVWVFNNGGFLLRLVDDQSANLPYVFSREEPFESGFAFVATCADVGIWNQTRDLFHAVTRGRQPEVGSACSVYLDGQPLRYGDADRLDVDRDSETVLVNESVALEMDFNRTYRLSARADGASPDCPVSINVVSANDPSRNRAALHLLDTEPHELDFTGATGWLGRRASFMLKVSAAPGSALASLVLAPAPMAAPRLNVPADGLSMTDIATYFRWYQIPGAFDYELQLARDPEFDEPTTIPVRSEVAMPYHIPADDALPATGQWYWRVRAVEPGRPGDWSVVRSFAVNDDTAKRPVTFEVSPERPIFTMEGCRVPDWSRFRDTLPADIKSRVVFNISPHGTEDYLAYYRPLAEMGQAVMIGTHSPSPMSHWRPLSMVEELFQTYTNIIGIQSGETLSALYEGGDTPYAARLLKLCGKYGRIFYNADGTYPGENKWQALCEKEWPLIREYGDHIIFAQKNNILHRQFVSQSSVLGLYLAGDILAQGAWEDGGWYWQQTGFGKLGEMFGQRGGDVTTMPRIFWTLNYVMGLGRGCSVFSFEGQVGTTPVPKDWKLAGQEDWPETATGPYRNPAAFWTTDGELTPTFYRFCLPFMRAVIHRGLVPSREQVLKNVKLAVYNDGVPIKKDGDQYYYEWEAVYRGTYGFRDFGVLPGSLMEYFPNTGRYFYFPALPQGKRDLGPGIDILPLSGLQESAQVRKVFDAAYPAWYSGDALVNLAGDTLTILNSNENFDERQTYSLPLHSRSGIDNLAGSIGPHAYVLGKFSGDSLWLQANSEYPERDTELTLICAAAPKVAVTPSSAAKVNRWDASSGKLELLLSHAGGAVEVEVMTQ